MSDKCACMRAGLHILDPAAKLGAPAGRGQLAAADADSVAAHDSDRFADDVTDRLAAHQRGRRDRSIHPQQVGCKGSQ